MNSWLRSKKALSHHLGNIVRGADIESKIIPSVTNLTPFNISTRQLDEWRRLHSILYKSMTGIIEQFANDIDAQSIMNLSDKEMDIINQCKHAYDPGSFRPDLVIDAKDEQAKICEINARFVMNAYYMTHFCAEGLKDINPMFECYPWPKGHDYLTEHFDLNEQIFVIKGREYGNDMYLFRLVHPNTHIIDIAEVCVNENSKQLCYKNNGKPIKQVILELHQSEILSLSPSILNAFIELSAKQKLLNDFRTIFIVHNKKFLRLLSDQNIMQRYVESSEVDFLQKNLIKSFYKSDMTNDQNIFEEVIGNKDEYILKPTLFGKGEGIIFGDECKNDEWIGHMQTLMHGDAYIIQQYIKQKTFSFRSVLTDEIVHQNVIPTLLCHNDSFYGPGINRTSPDRLIAVSRGGEILMPQIDDSLKQNFAIPYICDKESLFDECTLEYDENESIGAIGSKIMKLLKTKHKCLVDLGDIDDSAQSLIMQQIVNEIGRPHVHDADDNILWDVKVNKDEVNENKARSHTDKEFELHTDASFDVIPPRYFGLHFIKTDQLNGGLSQLISINDVIDKLSQDEIDQLLFEKYKIKIPKEFMKADGVEYNIGNILSLDAKSKEYFIRYRKDIIADDEHSDVLKKVENIFDILQDENEPQMVPENHILFVDNCHFLHSRTKINDSRRHLRRIRFHPNDDELLPIF